MLPEDGEGRMTMCWQVSERRQSAGQRRDPDGRGWREARRILLATGMVDGRFAWRSQRSEAGRKPSQVQVYEDAISWEEQGGRREGGMAGMHGHGRGEMSGRRWCRK